MHGKAAPVHSEMATLQRFSSFFRSINYRKIWQFQKTADMFELHPVEPHVGQDFQGLATAQSTEHK